MSLNANVGLQNLGNIQAPAKSLNNGVLPFGNSLFNNSIFNLQPSAVDYSQDIMMPDFLKNSNSQPSVSQPSAVQPQTSQQTTAPQISKSGNPYATQSFCAGENPQNVPQLQKPASIENSPIFQQDLTSLQNQINQQIAKQNTGISITEKGNVYKNSDSGKKIGFWGGLSAPILAAGYALAKGAKFSNAFNIKNLLIKCPLVGIAGLTAGALADYFINRTRANNADANSAQG